MPRLFMPIAAAFAPNYTLKDTLIAGKYLLPRKWEAMQSGKNIPRLEEKFREYMDAEKAVSFSSGRAGLWAILKAMEFEKGDEVILQAFTTVALPNTLKVLGLKPVFVDIQEGTYNIDPEKIEKKITSRTKAVIIQHTFGNPADMDRILQIAGKYDLKTIEDCAHSLGAEYDGIKTGKFSDAAFFSFGRDKVISSVSGGMVIARDYRLGEKIEAIRNGLDFPSRKDIIKNLLHPIITFKALHTYNLFSIGKMIMFMTYKIGLLDKAYSSEEKKGEMREDFAKRMPNALAEIALHQLEIADRFNKHRIKTAKKYEELLADNLDIKLPKTLPGSKNIFLWYTISLKNKRKLIKRANKKDIILGDWFPQAIGPIEVDMRKAGYEKGSCPIAERASARCVNLPTHHNIHKKEIAKVAEFINLS